MLRTSMPGNDDAGEETTQARIHIGNYDKVKAVSVLEREEPLVTTVDPYLAMAVLWMLGVHRRRSGDLAKAFADLQRALDLAHRLEETHYVASLTADVANVHLESGDPVKALASYEDSAHLLTSIGRHGTADQVMINVATANQRLGRDAEAEAVYENLLEKYSATYSRSLRSAVQLNLAVAKNKIGKTEDAVNIYQMVLQELAEERFSEATGRALVGLAGLYANQDRFSDALALLEEARAGHDQLGNTSNVLELRGLQADVLWDMGRRDEALEILIEAFERSKALSFARLTLDLGQSLEWRLNEHGDVQRAYRVLQQCSAIKDAVYANESERAVELGKVRASMTAEREAIYKRDEDRRRLMNDVLPAHIADRLLSGQQRIAERLDHVGILFADIVGFTQFAALRTPDEVLNRLEVLFQAIDQIMTLHRCEKIKTIGDSYMATNTTERSIDADGIVRLTRCALDMRDLAAQPEHSDLQLRIGLHAGPVVAGVMSGMRLAYDVWGDTVNLASRMESTSKLGKIQTTGVVADVLRLHEEFAVSSRTLIEVKGKGQLETFWIERA